MIKLRKWTRPCAFIQASGQCIWDNNPAAKKFITKRVERAEWNFQNGILRNINAPLPATLTCSGSGSWL